MYIYSRSVGRPAALVDIEDIEFLRNLRFSYTDVAKILGVSRSTIYRKTEDEGVSFKKHTEISDRILDGIVTDILLLGILARQNIILPRTRIRASIYRVDPEGTALRRSLAVCRRVYHAEGPNYVWHIDGYHKLIKYCFVIHGAMDTLE